MDDFRSPEDLFRDQTAKIRQAGQDFNKFVPYVLLVLLVVFIAQGAVYSIGPDEVGVVQRFGRYVRITEPGLHAKFPFGIESVTPIKVKKIFKEEFGFRTTAEGVRSVYANKGFYDESLMLTGDLNILDVRWTVQYRVLDPVKLLFQTRDPIGNVRAMSEVVMRRLCGDYTVDEVLTTKREEIASMAQDQLQDLLDKYDTGIQVVTVKLLDVNPPDVVKPAFNEVNEAKQEKERMINEAWEAYNKAIPSAKGEAKRTISQAEGYKLDKVNRAQGEAGRFNRTWEEYKKAPEITRKRLYLETMAEVLPSVKKIIVDPEQKSILPLFNVNGNGGQSK
ncbi:MAG: FtsH protease activity modulator HflK [Candidatus Omnitrophica bacterium]|nr:FtsH protease activity modulator HflK [Candidatus Omnitrophota bacterium]MDD5488649.1 FtsH protease activity modulator HflK [Candidatus Omnitrophota bacterium]